MNFSAPVHHAGRSAPRCWRSGCCWSASSPTVFLPVASMPNVELPTIRVSASRPGADPATMAATVAAPLERRLGRDRRRHRAHLGLARSARPRIIVQFDLVAQHRRRGARRAGRASTPRLTDLPSDLPSLPSFRKFNPAAAPVLILALTSKTVAPSAIYDAADTVVAQRISQVDGVAEVHGQRRRAAGHPRPRQSGRARRRRASRSRTCAPRSPTPTRTARSACFDGGRARRDDRHQRPAAPPPRLQDARREERRTATIVRLADIASVEQSIAQQPLAAWFNKPAVGAADHHQAGRRQRHRHGRPHPAR